MISIFSAIFVYADNDSYTVAVNYDDEEEQLVSDFRINHGYAKVIDVYDDKGNKLDASSYIYVRIRTYKKVGSKKIYSSWSSVKNVKTKK